MIAAKVRLRHVAALLVAALLAACGGGGGGTPSSLPAAPTGSGAPANAQFTITIPPKAAQSVPRNPKYISASTESVVITLVSVNGNPYASTTTAPASLATNLTPSSPNCAPSGGNLVCTAAATAVAGSDLYSIATYDATQTSTSPTTPAGNLLSQGSTTLTVTTGQTASTTLALNGVAASLAIAFTTNAHVSGSQGAGYAIVGNQPRTFTVTAMDADGNTIIGPGAPTYTVSSGSAAVAIASTATAGTYTAQVMSVNATPVQVSVTPSDGSAVSFTISTIQELWISNSAGNSVTAYDASTHAQLTGDTINGTAGLNAPFMIQTGPNGNLWISNFSGNSIEEVVPETNAALLTIDDGSTVIKTPFGISFDSSGNLYLDTGGSGNKLAKYTASSFAGLTGTQNIAPAATTTTNLSDPVQNAFDSSGVLWVANDGGGPNTQVTAYDASLTNVAVLGGANTQLNGAVGACFDSGGHLWVVNNSASTVSEFSTAGVTLVNGNIAPLTTIAGGATGMNSPVGCAFDAVGNLWVGNQNVNAVQQFAAGSIAGGGNLAPVATITAGTNRPTGMTFTP